MTDDEFLPIRDLEAMLYTPIKADLEAQFPGISVSGFPVNEPASFPFVSFTEADNYPVRSRLDSGDKERLTRFSYLLKVFSNKSSGKKAQVKEIAAYIDRELYLKNLVRRSCTPTIEADNASYVWLAARYEVEVDKDGKLYRPQTR